MDKRPIKDIFGSNGEMLIWFGKVERVEQKKIAEHFNFIFVK